MRLSGGAALGEEAAASALRAEAAEPGAEAAEPGAEAAEPGAEAAEPGAEAAELHAAEAAAPAVEIIDALGGLCVIRRRSPTLGGSVPLRVAQGCQPLLEGNAFGLQVVLTRSVRLARRLGRWSAALDPPEERIDRAWAAALPALDAQGLLPAGVLREELRRGLLVVHGAPFSRAPRVRFWTGLLVRPRAGLWLRVSATANRRNVLVRVADVILPDPARFVPLILELTPAPGVDELRIEGEIATLAALRPGVAFTIHDLVEAPEVARAHLDFYDAGYFATKRGEITRKYRRLATASPLGTCEVPSASRAPGAREVPSASRAPGAREQPSTSDAPGAREQPSTSDAPGAREQPSAGHAPRAPEVQAACEVIQAGPAGDPGFSIHGFDRCLLPEGEVAGVPSRYGRLDVVTFENRVGFRARWDGHAVAIHPDRPRLAEGAAGVEARFRAALGAAAGGEAHRGALWYLTRYFSPHPPGEPHFFVKPWAFTRTPPGWSSLLEGEHGEGFDVLRGVVQTDWFFATPAVLQLHRPGLEVHVPERRPLLRVIPVPRDLLAPRCVVRPLLPGGPAAAGGGGDAA